jgi:Tol biopolymer transport system component
VSLPAAGLAVVFGQLATAQVSRGLVARTVASALTPGALSVSVATLANGATRALLPTRPIFAPLGVTLLATVMIATTAIGIDSKATPAGLKEPAKAAPPDEKSSPPGPSAKGPNKLLFYREEAGGTYVLTDPDGRNEKRLTEIVGTHRAIEARFSPDGASIAFIECMPQPPALPAPTFLFRLLGSGNRPTEPTRTLLLRRLDGVGPEVNLGSCDLFALSPNGAEIAIGKWGDRVEGAFPLVTHSILNVKTQQKAPLKLPAYHTITDWSPDGRYFLTDFRRKGKDGPECRIHMINRDGTEHKVLSGPTEPSRSHGRFSPDGTRVLCEEFGPPIGNIFGLPRKLVVIDVASGKATPVPDTTVQGEILGFCWSPDGKKIAYSWREHHNVPANEAAEKETESRLVVCDSDGNNAKTILTANGNGESAVTIKGPDWR